MIEQMSFDLSNRLEEGCNVKVIANVGKAEDVESQYYLPQFEGKKGELVQIFRKSNPVAFEVKFAKGYGIFNENEIQRI